MPWKVLGQKWHLARKGFPPGKKISWDVDVLEELCEMLSEASGGQFLWNNQQVVHVFVEGQKEPWATIHTKRLDAIELALSGPKDRFAFGSVAGLGVEPELQTDKPDRDLLKLKLRTVADLERNDLAGFLKEHCQGSRGE